MSEISFIKRINDLALFFSVFNFLIALIYKPKTGLGDFALYSSILFVIWILRRKNNNRKYSVLALLMLLVFFQVRSVYDMLYYGGLFLYGVYSVTRSKDIINYAEESSLFKKKIAVIIVMLLYAIAASEINTIETVTIPYSIIFITTSVVILRTLRYAKYNENMRNINEINIKFAAAVTLISFLLSISAVREFILSIMAVAYELITNMILSIYYYICIGIGYLIKVIAVTVFGIKKLPKLKFPMQLSLGDEIAGKRPDTAAELIKTVRENGNFDIIMKVIGVGFVLLIIIKIMHSGAESYSKQESFKESKEKMERDNAGRRGILKGISGLVRPKSVNEYIRYYYKKFLITSVNRGADISRSDTTWEINKKTEGLYNKESLKKIRDIYIRVRYGNYMGDKSTSKEFRNCYEEMKSRK